MRKIYVVMDKEGRTWGEFAPSGASADELHGKLKPSSGFGEVSGVFKAHEIAMTTGGDDASRSASAIVALGAYLVDKATGSRVDIDGVIFVSEDLLVSCRLA